jgi:hypothetical protein
MRIVRPGDTYRDSFAVQSSTGAAANADSLPTAAAYKNGTADGAVTVTVANATTGAYVLSFAVPGGYAAGDVVQALVTAVVGGVTVVGWSSPVTVAGFPATALPNAAAGANGGVPTGNASGHVTLADGSLTTGKLGAFALAKTTNITGFNDVAAGAAMTLTAGERTAVANEVEAQIIDETDSEKVLTAITDKIASANPSLSGLTLGAIASAVRDVANASPAADSLGAAVNAVKERTSNLPDDPADESLVIAAADAIMTRLGAPAGASVSADVAALPAATGAVVTAAHGGGSYLRNTEPPTAAAISSQVASDLAAAHGAGSWVTATGFATPGAAMTLTAAGLDAVLVAGKPLPVALRIIGAAVAGPLTDSQTDEEAFLDFAGTLSHTVTADASGNRTLITYA